MVVGINITDTIPIKDDTSAQFITDGITATTTAVTIKNPISNSAISRIIKQSTAIKKGTITNTAEVNTGLIRYANMA